MAKEIIHEQELKMVIMDVLSELSLTVGNTMGYFGKNVIIQRPSGVSYTTKDGVSVIKSIDYEDKVKKIICDIVKDVASRVVNECGDGTTTSVILTEAIYRYGYDVIFKNDKNVTEIKQGMEYAVNEIIEYLRQNSSMIDMKTQDLFNIAKISANGDDTVASMLIDVVKEVGREGVIIVTENKGLDTIVDITQGFQVDSGLVSPEFLAENQSELVFTNCNIVIVNKKLVQFAEFQPILEQVHVKKESLVFFAPDFSQDFVDFAVANLKSAGLNIACVRLPYRGDIQSGYAEDMALISEGGIMGLSFAIQKTDPMDKVGKVKELILKKDTVIFSEIDDDKLETVILSRVAFLRKMLEDTIDNQLLSEHIQRRLSKLTGGFANIRIGGASQIELLEKKDRVEDALNAIKAAMDEGYLAGGGTMFIRAINVLDKIRFDDDRQFGVEIIKLAIQEPFIRLLSNAGMDYKHLIPQVKKSKNKFFGYNLVSRQMEDLYRAGVIDPAKVLKSTLKNSLSTASMLLSTSDLVLNNKIKVNDMY